MKILHLLIVIILITACSGAKRVIDSTPKEIAETSVMFKDSIISEPENMQVLIDSIEVVHKNESENFNQILTKRTIEIHELWNELLKKHVSENGNVNYNGFKSDHKKLLDYIHVLNLAITNTNFETTSKEDKLAYWINAYNAMTIDLILRNYPIKSIKDIKDPWDQRLWKLDEKWYNLNDIEHQILRKMDEPRIHFAIVCASVSCPKLSNEAHSPENIEQQLSKATKDFLSDSSKNTITSDRMELSKIFQWFTKDFTQNGSLIDFINQYSEIEISNQAKKSFKEYNWDLND